jgi:hypothetical protein
VVDMNNKSLIYGMLERENVLVDETREHGTGA